MTIFEKYEEKEGKYLSAVENLYADYVKMIIADENTKLDYNQLNETQSARRLAKNELEKLIKMIIESSSITLEEANYVFPNLLRSISSRGREEYRVHVISFEDTEYLELYRVDFDYSKESSQFPIILGKRKKNSKELEFSFYWAAQLDKKEFLEGFEMYNAGSELLNNIINFVKTYIDYKVNGEVNSWTDFANRYYTFGELNPYDEEEIEQIEFYHDMDAIKHAKRRKAAIAARKAKEEKTYPRKARLLTNEGKVNSYYKNAAIYLQESYTEEELLSLESLLRNYSSEELSNLISIIINNPGYLPKEYSRELKNNK